MARTERQLINSSYRCPEV